MFDFKITPDDGEPFEVTATSRDIRRWERAGRGRAFAQLSGEGLTMDALYGIAYAACVRHGKAAPGTEAQFADSNDLEILGGEDEEVSDEDSPTQPGA